MSVQYSTDDSWVRVPTQKEEGKTCSLLCKRNPHNSFMLAVGALDLTCTYKYIHDVKAGSKYFALQTHSSMFIDAPAAMSLDKAEQPPAAFWDEKG